MCIESLPDEVVMSGTTLARDRMSRTASNCRSHTCDPIDGLVRMARR